MAIKYLSMFFIMLVTLITICVSTTIYALSGNTIEIKDVLKTGDFVKSNLYFQNANLTFGDKNKICPENNCKYEFQDVTFDEFMDSRHLSGTIKIEDKQQPPSEDNFTTFIFYKISGSFNLKSSKENSETGEKILNYVGDMGLDPEGSMFNPQYEFTSNVVLKQPENTFILQGRSK